MTAIGLTLGLVDRTPLVILPYYGVLFLLALPVLRWRAARLMVLAAVAAVTTPIVSHFLRTSGSQAIWGNLSWTHVVSDPVGSARDLLLTGSYPVITWSTYLFAGMAVGRLGPGPRVHRRGSRRARWRPRARRLDGWRLHPLRGRPLSSDRGAAGTGRCGADPRHRDAAPVLRVAPRHRLGGGWESVLRTSAPPPTSCTRPVRHWSRWGSACLPSPGSGCLLDPSSLPAP